MKMFNKIEDRLMIPFMKFKDEKQENNFILEYNDSTVLKVAFDTSYESDNGLDLDEEGYEEYWGVAFELKEIVKEGNSVPCKIGELFEVNYKNFPYIIKSGDGEIVVKNM